jgi:hypothetical protein
MEKTDGENSKREAGLLILSSGTLKYLCATDTAVMFLSCALAIMLCIT